jgi:hypothetical protein
MALNRGCTSAALNYIELSHGRRASRALPGKFIENI